MSRRNVAPTCRIKNAQNAWKLQERDIVYYLSRRPSRECCACLCIAVISCNDSSIADLDGIKSFFQRGNPKTHPQLSIQFGVELSFERSGRQLRVGLGAALKEGADRALGEMPSRGRLLAHSSNPVVLSCGRSSSVDADISLRGFQSRLWESYLIPLVAQITTDHRGTICRIKVSL